MIVSASYKSDIPAFYAEWFVNRLRAGFCRMLNPFNRKQVSTISLKPEDVDGFVFWTKNIGPFLGALDQVRRMNKPFIVQHTINGYPRELESRVVDVDRAVSQMHALADKFGPAVPVWRYDTIVQSSLTGWDFHRRNFEKLCTHLERTTDEVVVSFLQLYQKTRRNLDASAAEHNFDWTDPPIGEKRVLLRDLTAMASSRGMKLTLCTQPELVIPGVGEAKCIDAVRLMRIGGTEFAAKVKGMRQGCGCFESKDIGDYDTCPHGCGYCYAVRDRELALRRYQQHDPEGEFLFGGPSTRVKQLPLFDG